MYYLTHDKSQCVEVVRFDQTQREIFFPVLIILILVADEKHFQQCHIAHAY